MGDSFRNSAAPQAEFNYFRCQTAYGKPARRIWQPFTIKSLGLGLEDRFGLIMLPIYMNLRIPTLRCNGRNFEVNHLITLELGGSNKLSNLWPPPYHPQPGARVRAPRHDRWMAA